MCKLVEGKNARVCCGCKELKSFSEFHKSKSAKYGYNSRCKSCMKVRALARGVRKKAELSGMISFEGLNLPPELIYILGFFYADGHVTADYSKAVLELVSDDCSNLIKLMNTLDMSFSVRTRYRNNSNNEQTCITILANDKFRDYFLKIKENKDDLSWPTSLIPVNQHYLFYRGFFDGDGGVYQKGRSSSLYFYGPLDQNWDPLTDFMVSSNIKYSCRAVLRKGGTHKSSHLQVSNRVGISKIYKYLYPSGYDFGLKRKYAILEDIHRCHKDVARERTIKPAVKAVKLLKTYANC